LDSLQPTDVYQHLKTAHDSTTIGILLGRAASKIGKMDESDSKMMCLHIPALLPHTLSVDYSLPVQSAAVIGAGLLYQATSNRQITEMLLS
jgi:anaphase-promoting complex subunit 1